MYYDDIGRNDVPVLANLLKKNPKRGILDTKVQGQCPTCAGTHITSTEYFSERIHTCLDCGEKFRVW